VGRLAAEKNLLLAVEAFEALAPRHGDARLVLVGDGPLREELARRCPRAFFAGQRDGWTWQRITRRPTCSCSPA
jgi:glycosyltransferase involved in cell wall biosynthesis